MWSQVGQLRDEEGLRAALAVIDRIERGLPPGASEPRNLCTVARLVARAALARRESRGSHFRRDFPLPDPAFARRLRFAGDGDALEAPAALEVAS
jgi:L-aspartate oxidase